MISIGCRCIVAVFIIVDFDRLVVDHISFGGKEISLVSHVERAIKSTRENLSVNVPFLLIDDVVMVAFLGEVRVEVTLDNGLLVGAASFFTGCLRR